MKKAKKTSPKESQSLQITRITRTLYFMGILYALSLIIFDSGNLLTREAVAQRWTLLSVLFIVNTIAWYSNVQQNSHSKIRTTQLTTLLVITTLVFAGFTTYWERGMASTSTIFYIVPLIISATLHNRHALVTTASLSAVTYSFASVKYFNDFFNEGYRIQLWGHIVLYTGFIFGITWLIMVLSGLRHDSR